MASYERWLSAPRPSIISRRNSREMPGASFRKSTGSPFALRATPAYLPGKKPAPHKRAEIACTLEYGLECMACNTTKVGKSSFIDPRPYATHDPMEALPVIIEPV